MPKLFQRYEEIVSGFDRRLAARLRALLQAAGVYCAAMLLLVGAHFWGVSTLSSPYTWALPGAFVLLNVALLRLAFDRRTHDWQRSKLVLAHATCAIAAAAAYTVAHHGGPELPAFLILVAVLAAVPRISATSLKSLSLAACGAFALALAARMEGGSDVARVGANATALVALATSLGLLNLYAARVNHRHLQAHIALARLQSTIRVLSARSDRETWQRSFRREHVSSILEKEKARADRTGRRFSICMLDHTDGNATADATPDAVGRSIGGLAERAGRILRATDTVSCTRYRRSLGRSGAEEFIAVLPETRLAHARLCAERLTRLGVTGLAASRPAAAALVAGIAEYEPGESIAALLRRADQALHAAQASGAGAIKGALSAHHVGRPPPKPRLRVVR